MRDYFELISRDLQNKASLIREYFKIHQGENGRNKEDLLIEFLRDYLPKRYSLGTGFIIDTVGDNSNQNDIIIYDSFWSSILFPNNVSQFFPVESVYGVIEVKSMLNQAELKSTMTKAARIKKMPFKGIQQSPADLGIKEPLYTIFAYDSIDLKAIKIYLETEYGNTPLSERIDFIIVLNQGLFQTGNYFEIVHYGHPQSPFRKELGDEGMKKVKEKYPKEIVAWKLNENSLFVWYMWMMTYLSFSKNKISNLIDYLPKGTQWGTEIK